MLAQEQSVCLVFNRPSFLLLETSSTWSLCPASMHWHHPMAWQVLAIFTGKGLAGPLLCLLLLHLPTKWTELCCEKNVDAFDPEDTGTLE